MAEILTKISAPDLGENYGANIKTTFDNINKNFGVIGSKGFSEGPAGDGWRFDSIALSSLLDGDDNKYVDGIRTAIGETGSDTDVDALINQLKNSSAPITVGRVNSDLPDADEPWENSYPIVFIDERFADLDTVDHEAVDLSGMLVLNSVTFEEGAVTSTTWNFTQPFPTLYYKTVEGVGGFYWKINGNKTDIPAQGPTGSAGKDGRFWLVRINSDSSASGGNVGLTYYMSADSTSTSWRNDWDKFEGKNGDSCIVIKDGDISEYWISNIHKVNDDSFEAWVGDSNKMVVTQNFDEQAFFNLMKHVTPSADYTKSLFVKAYDSDNTCAFGLDGDGVMKIGMAGEDGALRKEGDSYSANLDDPLIVIGGRVATQYGSMRSISYNKANGEGSHAEGSGTKAIGVYSHAEGAYTTAEGNYSHAEGGARGANGLCSHAEGFGTITEGDESHAEGEGTVAKGNYSHAEGDETITYGTSSHAEGNKTIALGDYSHAEGFGDLTLDYLSGETIYTESPYDSFWYDYDATILDEYKINAGDILKIHYIEYGVDNPVIRKVAGVLIESNKFIVYLDSPITTSSTISNISQVDLFNNISSGIGSHTEGSGTKAKGNYSHAEGDKTIALGDYSHAEGEGTVAKGNYSHAEGFHTTTSNPYEFACGESNVTGYMHYDNVKNKWYIHDNCLDSTGECIIFSIGGGRTEFENIDDSSDKTRLSYNVLVVTNGWNASSNEGHLGKIFAATGYFYQYTIEGEQYKKVLYKIISN